MNKFKLENLTLNELEALSIKILHEIENRKKEIKKSTSSNKDEVRAYKDFDEYNHRRYSRPWIAKVTGWSVGDYPILEFGTYIGEHGEAGQVEIMVSVGTLVKYGQKDYYQSNKTINQFAIVQSNGKLKDITPLEAKKLFITQRIIN